MKFITVVIFLLLSLPLLAQTRKLDSMNVLIRQASSDTQRINRQNARAAIWGEVNLDSAIAQATANILASQAIRFAAGEARARVILAGRLCFKGLYPEAHKHLLTAEKIYMVLNDSAGLANTYLIMGNYYGMQSMYDSTVVYFTKSIAIGERINLQTLVNSAYANMAIGYQMQSDYTHALMYFQKALKSAEALNNFGSQAHIFLNMALTYQSMLDYDRAEKNYLKSIRLAKREGIVNVELYGYSNLSSLFQERENFQESYKYAMKAAVMAKNMGDNGMEASNTSRAALQLANMKKFDQAASLIKKALLLAENTQKYNIFQVNGDAGSILTMQEKYSEALPLLKKSIAAIENTQLYERSARDNYENLSLCYEKTGDFEKALQTYKMSSKIADSLRSKENIRKSTELSMNFEFERTQQLQQAEQRRRDSEHQFRQNALLAGAGLLLIVAATAFYAFTNKRKANAMLQQQKTDLETTLNELKNTQKQLIHSEKMASLGELTAGIAHEIQNPLNFVNNFSEISIDLLKEADEELANGHYQQAAALTSEASQNLEKIVHHGKRADAIVKGMLMHSRSGEIKKEPTNINDLADEYIRLSYHGMRVKDNMFNVDLRTVYDPDAGSLNIVRQDIGRVLLNLLNNAFYAVKEKKLKETEGYTPIVWITTKRKQDKVEITIKDNGDGIPQNIRDKIFQPFFSTKPTGQGTGLGLSISYDIVTKEHSGQLDVTSSQHEGTSFVITLS